MIKSLSIFAITLVVSSCAKKTESQYDFVTVPTTGDPVMLNESSRSMRSLQTLSGEKTYINNYLFKGSSKCVSTSLVSEIYLGGVFKWSFPDGRFVEDIIKPSRDYKKSICDAYSEPGTYDHATTSILEGVKNTEKLLEENVSSFTKVKLRVAPLINMHSRSKAGKTVYNQSKYLVNNAYYNPYSKEITFLPQGRSLRGAIPFSSVPLWNIPFVPSHEFGHHIFNEIVGDELLVSGHTCFDQSHQELTSSTPATNEKLLSAVNEGFADLIGKMSSDKNFSFRGIDCFEHSRDVQNNSFYDGTMKTLNIHFWNEFVSPTPRRIYSCNQTNYSEIHHFGALIAHGLYHTMKLHGGYNIDVLLDWIKYFKGSYNSFSSIKENMRVVIQSFDKALKNNIEVNNINTCDTLASKFPLFTEDEICSEK